MYGHLRRQTSHRGRGGGKTPPPATCPAADGDGSRAFLGVAFSRRSDEGGGSLIARSVCRPGTETVRSDVRDNLQARQATKSDSFKTFREDFKIVCVVEI
jgi:hypothetical protein